MGLSRAAVAGRDTGVHPMVDTDVLYARKSYFYHKANINDLEINLKS
jgi:hypothetical protein